MVVSMHLGNTLIIIVECMTLRNGFLATKNNGVFRFRD